MNESDPASKKRRAAPFDARFEQEVISAIGLILRNMQTTMLSAFEAFGRDADVRIRKLQADHSNLETASELRIAAVEERLFEIEKKLFGVQ